MTKVAATAFVLRVRHPSGAEELCALGTDPVMLGRAAINTVVLADPLASRFHARVEWHDGRFVLLDRGSKNGTLLGDEPVRAHPLAPGDELRLGDTIVVFEEAPTAPDLPSAKSDDETESETVLQQRTPPPPVDAAGAEAVTILSEVLAAAGDELSVLEDVALHLRSVVACDRATIILVEDGTQPLMRFCRAALPGDEAEGPDEQVIRAGLTAERAIALSVPRAAGVLDATLGVSRHVLLVPLVTDESRLGLVALERDPSRAPFGERDIRLASTAASCITSFLRSVL